MPLSNTDSLIHAFTMATSFLPSCGSTYGCVLFWLMHESVLSVCTVQHELVCKVGLFCLILRVHISFWTMLTHLYCMKAHCAQSWKRRMRAALCTGSEISTSFEYQCVKSTVTATKWAVIQEQTMARRSGKKNNNKKNQIARRQRDRRSFM